MSGETLVVSFVVRFIGQTADNRLQATHGIIRHVQSNTEQHFTCWEEVAGFIARYVVVDSLPADSTDLPPPAAG